MDLSLDGVAEANEKWRFNYMSPDLAEYYSQKVNSLDAMLLGRKAYEIFAAFWPKQTHNEFGIADKLNSAQKFIVSSTLNQTEWRNSTIIRER
jgi:dihydrofolate reductase